MENNLQKFLESFSLGLEKSPNYENLKALEPYIDETIEREIREIASELSSVFIDRLADVLQERGLALDGHKVVAGFASRENKSPKDEREQCQSEDL